MNVFEFRDRLIEEYSWFTKSFTRILADDIHIEIEKEYEKGRFWPSPLIQLNPNFVSSESVDDLVRRGVLHRTCARIFRLKTENGEREMKLYKHQTDAIEVAKQKESYVVTTGTGSGKSLSYFIPIVDDVLRRRENGDDNRKISAIVVYPMNALCNSQAQELEKYLKYELVSGERPVTYARYTGQENEEERRKIISDPPDILLTNYAMLELMMTRHNEIDKNLRKHAEGLRFLVLDELHTYRGRQGADVAMLVRRVRERFNLDLLCIGTSATMASEGNERERNQTVAKIASKLFGVEVRPENIITESLEPITKPNVSTDSESLAKEIKRGVPDNPTYEELEIHPVAAWVEKNLGIEEREGKIVRVSKPMSINEAARKLARDSNLSEEKCLEYLKKFLLKAYQTKNDKGKRFFVFRIHQFISGAGDAYTTLEAPGVRHVTVEGQQYKPGDREKRLFNVVFCRKCGQEYYPVWTILDGNGIVSFDPRDLGDVADGNDEIQMGYLMPDTAGIFDPNQPEKHFPEEWLEERNGVIDLKRSYKKYEPVQKMVNTKGEAVSEGLPVWYMPGRFRVCLNCGAYYDQHYRNDFPKLSRLTSEGRSSATTVLVLSAMRYLADSELDPAAKKVLGFTDNRQDASLQAGHFNDFVQILLLRGALLAALKDAQGKSLRDDTIAEQVWNKLGLTPYDYAANPIASGPQTKRIKQTLLDVLGYRLYIDLQRGWRFTSPNLEQLNLLSIEYDGLKDCCEDQSVWKECKSYLATATPEEREKVAKQILDHMRKHLCIKSIYLDESFQQRMKNRSYTDLVEPWGLSEEEKTLSSAYMVPEPKPRRIQSDEHLVFASYRSRVGKQVCRHGGKEEYEKVIADLMSALESYDLVERTEDLSGGYVGYQIKSSCLEWTLPENQSNDENVNRFFRSLYENVSELLNQGDRFLYQLEAREHTAQVEPKEREEREKRFRMGLSRVGVNGKEQTGGLPVLFCSPTMELGIDIATLNAVYMRNVPPTPANYAQRSGRAGRSGQPAIVITYCAPRSPHDQYFFSDPAKMVSGVVNPPNIDLANEDLIRSHLHAVWLAETGQDLSSSVIDLLDLNQLEVLPLKAEIRDQMAREKVREATRERASNIMDMLSKELSKENAPWFTSTWKESIIRGVMERFNQAFDRWRTLYRATISQKNRAWEVLNNPVATEEDRRRSTARLNEAIAQEDLLRNRDETINSDFYTYRYLANEGFLPGYNFPRLPLLAYIPGRKARTKDDQFLSRPRFLGLSEFGPGAFIYHEGSRYVVKQAILSLREFADNNKALPTQEIRICSQCGYGHFGDQTGFELCVNCSSQLGDGVNISNLFRIEQVATRRRDRITSDEEERQRLGYETRTSVRFAEDDGRLRYESITVKDDKEELVKLRYGPAATVWKINLGWRRRKNGNMFGFNIDVNTGEWVKDSQTPVELDDDLNNGNHVERVTPYVEDTKNILLLRPCVSLSQESFVTLQYAIKRGIESEFQLEEDELAVQLLPRPEDPRTILVYEAAEGGVGVLTRLITEPDIISRVAQKALEICHYTSNSGEWSGANDLLDNKQECEAGCYQCLLSYRNQPDHKYIDRRNDEVREFLCRLIHAGTTRQQTPHSKKETIEQLQNASSSSLEKKWLESLERRGYMSPDTAQPFLEEFSTRPDFVYWDKQVLVYIDGPHHNRPSQRQADEELTRHLEARGFTVIRFPEDTRRWPEVFSSYSWVFGKGRNEAEEQL